VQLPPPVRRPAAGEVVVQTHCFRYGTLKKIQIPSYDGRRRGATRHGQVGWFMAIKEVLAVTYNVLARFAHPLLLALFSGGR
jgi:hypothetical protein